MVSRSDSLRRVIESHCGANLTTDQRRLYAAARALLDGPQYLVWLDEVFAIGDPGALMDWLVSSSGADFLVKYLLITGFYASHAPDLRDYAMGKIKTLEKDLKQEAAAILCRPFLYMDVAHTGYLM